MDRGVATNSGWGGRGEGVGSTRDLFSIGRRKVA